MSSATRPVLDVALVTVDIIPSFNCSSISLQVPWQTFSTSSGFESKGEITSQARGFRSVTSVSNEAGAAQMIRVTFSRVCGPMWTAWLPATIAVASTCVGTVSHMFALPALRRFFSFFLIKTIQNHHNFGTGKILGRARTVFQQTPLVQKASG